ncbi:MAG: hypothetical protein QNK23_16475 [Crocinitomicaceae bacterium]|nr:hypothetical protein [Crocinitomicaceae bacterium]
MEKRKDYWEYEKGIDYTTVYQTVFGMPKTEEEIRVNYDPSVENLLEAYQKYSNQAEIKLASIIEEEKISAKEITDNPYTQQFLLIKDIVPTLGMIDNESVKKRLKEIGLDKTILNMVDIPSILNELELLSESIGLHKNMYKPIILMVSSMVLLKMRMTIEKDYEHIEEEGEGTIVHSKWLINKAYRQARENKTKLEFENDMDEFLSSEEGIAHMKIMKELLAKNQSDGYNMRFVIQKIFEALSIASNLKDQSKNQQYKTLYPLFRKIYPERKMYKNADEYDRFEPSKKSKKRTYDDFEEYQVGNMKTILGTTRPSKGLESLI